MKFAFKSNFGFGGVSSGKRSVGTGSVTGLALSAPTLTRTSGATTYPPTADFTRPIDWVDGDVGVMQRSQDWTFATGVSEATQTILAATTTYNFGLSSIVSGVWYIRMAAYRTARPGTLNWSNIQVVGDTVAPTLSGGTTSANEKLPVAVTITANEASTYVLGGTDAALMELYGTQPATTIGVRLLANAVPDYELKQSYSYTVTATDLAGNVSSTLACTHTVNLVAERLMLWNPLDTPSGGANSLTISNGRLTASNPGAGASTPIGVRMEISPPYTSGKWVYALSIDLIGSVYFSSMPSLVDPSTSLTNYPGYVYAVPSLGYYSSGDPFYNGVHQYGTLDPNLTAGMGFVFAFSLVSGTTWRVWTGRQATAGANNAVTWHDNDPSTGTGGFTIDMPNGIVPAWFSSDPTDQVTLFALTTPPTGFTNVGH